MKLTSKERKHLEYTRDNGPVVRWPKWASESMIRRLDGRGLHARTYSAEGKFRFLGYAITSAGRAALQGSGS